MSVEFIHRHSWSVTPHGNEIIVTIISFSGTDIKQTAPYFIQWCDVYSGKVYALSFFTEGETLHFLAGCFVSTHRGVVMGVVPRGA